jgi:hypothetical protein
MLPFGDASNRAMALGRKRPDHLCASACFWRGRNGRSGRLIVPRQARLMVLLPSVRVCVPRIGARPIS